MLIRLRKNQPEVQYPFTASCLMPTVLSTNNSVPLTLSVSPVDKFKVSALIYHPECVYTFASSPMCQNRQLFKTCAILHQPPTVTTFVSAPYYHSPSPALPLCQQMQPTARLPASTRRPALAVATSPETSPTVDADPRATLKKLFIKEKEAEQCWHWCCYFLCAHISRFLGLQPAASYSPSWLCFHTATLFAIFP